LFNPLFDGAIDLPWWGLVLVALGFTHITIASVTIYLHRHQAHRALDLHPAVANIFRFWLWLTTGMVTREWVAIHRKHHAFVETADDPHSPQIYGIGRLVFGGVFLYVDESHNQETLRRYSHGTPDDWMERNVYQRWSVMGLVLMGLINITLFGIVPGLLILVVQIAWIPFWAAGIINGVGHYWGYRTFASNDASTNISPWGILIGGEELHNNHHAYATSAKLSNRWYEFDIGWLYIQTLATLGLARVKKVAPKVKLGASKSVLDFDSLQAVLTHRYDILARYAQSLKETYAQELARLQRLSPGDAAALAGLRRWLVRDVATVPEGERESLERVLAKATTLRTLFNMRQELMAVWERSSATREQLLGQLEDWCRRAEASGIAQLVELSGRMRRYA
jgi:stearoyl-CoA desaturase (delta-9 desaturase)